MEVISLISVPSMASKSSVRATYDEDMIERDQGYLCKEAKLQI